MSALATRAELVKLGETFAIDSGELAFLEGVPAEQLRELRIAIYEQMFRDDRGVFERLGALTGYVPARAAARIAERALGPLVTARVAAEMHGRRGAAIVAHVSTSFLADLAAHLDPRRTRDVLRLVPAERIVALARELERRGDFTTMSRFAEVFSDETVRAVVEALDDEAAILRIAFFISSKNRLDHLLGLLPDERIEALLRRTEEESEELLPAFLSLMVHVSYARKRRLGDLAAAQEEPVLNGYIRAAHDQGLWGDMLPVVAAMSRPARERVANLPVLAEPDVQRGIVLAADAHRLWGIVLELVALMDEPNREAVAAIAAELPGAALVRAADAALMGEHWETLLDLARRMPIERQRGLARIAGGIGEVDPGLRDRLVRQASEAGMAEAFAAAPAPG